MMKGEVFYSLLLWLCLHEKADLHTLSQDGSSDINRTRLKRQDNISGISCTLPSHPENGRWSILNGAGRPGGQIPKNSVLEFECDPGYKLNQGPYLVCNDNWTTFNVPECEKLCPPMYSSATTNLTCVSKLGNAVKCDEAADGSRLTYTCIPYYESPSGYKKTILCFDGTWNFPRPVCQPVCGKKIEKETIPLAFGAVVKDHREYPWVVALYQKRAGVFENMCGGSILSPRIVITAAHCVTNNYGDALPKEEFMLGAGKYYNKFGDSRDKSAQYTEIARIVVHSGYKAASQQYNADIAILVSKELITLNDAVQPICYVDVNNIHLHAGDIGVVTGWGRKEDGDPSEELRTLEIPFKYPDSCESELPKDWARKFIMQDKICAGFLEQNKSVCPGDSGNSLFFKNEDDNRYYIHGLVSIAPSLKGECNPQQNSLYTKVGYYYEFIDREVTKHYVEQCTLPHYPENGKWIVKNQQKKPGDLVSSNTVLKVQCNQGYKLSSNSAFIDCESAFQLPTCELLCPQLNFPPGTDFKCTNNKGNEITCPEATEGTVVTFTCPKGYKPSEGNTSVRTCKLGSWGHLKPGCVEDKNIPVLQTSPTSSPKVICKYASWQSYQGVDPEHFNASLCTHVIYEYIGLWDNGNVRVQDDPLDLDNGEQKGLYRRVTEMKKRNPDLKVLLGVGGTQASNASLFSIMAADEHKRPAFLGSTDYFIKTYNFDGLDIDWIAPEESEKSVYVNLLREIRAKFKGKKWLLTASVHYDPSNRGYDGKAMNELLDWVNIKTYDMYGPHSSFTGQSSALYPSGEENSWERTHLNIAASAKNWMAAGLSKQKITLGISFYGRSFTLKDENVRGTHAPAVSSGPGELEGFVRYSEICLKYIPNWIAAWDDSQKNPYLYKENKWIGYDSKDSVWIKADYVKVNGFFGVNVWPVDGDDVHGKCGMKQILLKHVHGGMGNTPNWNDDIL